ncbi:MAG: aminoglycoside phosphotransferase family protein [Bacillota bacterium]|nr:aminoglycoside phosphotransferase family protein [Bacillota bacterium]
MDSSWERIQPYIEVDRITAEKMLSKVRPHKKIQEMGLIKKGLRNSNYYIDYEDCRLLLRIYGTGDDWYRKERAVYEHIKGKVSVPELLYMEEQHEIIDKPYAIFEYVSGPTLDEFLLQSKHDRKLMQIIGRNLALIHETHYTEVGFFDADLKVSVRLPDLQQWYAMFLKGNAAKKLGDRLTEDILNYVRKNEINIRRIEERIAFVHNDFRPINIIVKGDVPYIIDWEGSMAGHVLGDIGQFLRIEAQVPAELERVFIGSYNDTSGNRLPEDYKELARLRDLVNLLQMLNTEYDLKNKDRDVIKMIRSICSGRKG